MSLLLPVTLDFGADLKFIPGGGGRKSVILTHENA